MVAQHAKATRAKLQKTPARLTTTISFTGSTAVVTAEWMTSPIGWRVDFSSRAGNQSEALASIIQRDGFWYVIDGSRSGKYGPYEAPFSNPNVPLFFQLSQPRPPGAIRPGTHFESMDGSIATYRTPVWEPLRGQLQSMLDQFNKLSSADAAHAQGVGQTVNMIRDMLAHGITTRIDVQSGYVTETVNPKMTIRCSGFIWLDKPDIGAVDISSREWTDHTNAALASDPNDLVMMNHDGTWAPPKPGGDMDARVINSKTGETWRVPFHGGTAVAGCFFKDRRSVIISGADALSGGLVLYSVNLKTGANKRIGDPAVADGINLFPTMSHDGRTLAVLHKGGGQSILESQILLIDMATGQSQPLGKLMDTAFISWLADDSGLVLVQRKYASMDQAAATSIARINLQGEVTVLRPGDSPVVLPAGRILFMDRSVKPAVWDTCALDGSDAKPIGDGLAGFGFPAVSADGQHLLMMHFSGNRTVGPVPTVMDIDGTNPRALQLDPGLWSGPVW